MNMIFQGTSLMDQQAQKSSTRLSKMNEEIAEYEFQARKAAVQRRFKISKVRNRKIEEKENQRPIVIGSDKKREQNLIPRVQKILCEIKVLNQSTRDNNREKTNPTRIHTSNTEMGGKFTEHIYERQQCWQKTM